MRMPHEADEKNHLCPACGHDANNARRSCRAAYNRVRVSASALLEIMGREDADEIPGVIIGDMRDEVETITKFFHEFSAYKNAAKRDT